MFVRLFKFFELSWASRIELKKWMHHDTSRDGFSGENLENNPSLQIATAKNSDGETVTHVVAEPCYLLSAFMNNPSTSPSERQQAADEIDAVLAHKAASNGVSKLLIVVPDSHPSEPDERWVRIIQREVPLPVSAHVVCHTGNRAFVN